MKRNVFVFRSFRRTGGSLLWAGQRFVRWRRRHPSGRNHLWHCQRQGSYQSLTALLSMRLNGRLLQLTSLTIEHKICSVLHFGSLCRTVLGLMQSSLRVLLLFYRLPYLPSTSCLKRATNGNQYLYVSKSHVWSHFFLHLYYHVWWACFGYSLSVFFDDYCLAWSVQPCMISNQPKVLSSPENLCCSFKLKLMLFWNFYFYLEGWKK